MTEMPIAETNFTTQSTNRFNQKENNRNGIKCAIHEGFEILGP